MKSSVELPIANLDLSDKFDFDFVIASTCFDHYEYKEWYTNSDRFMILDNGSFETGEAVPDKDYLELAHLLQPDVLVIPDVPYDTYGTIQRYTLFMQEWKANPVGNCELMGVIQANGNNSAGHMMATVYYTNGIEWMGIPYISMLDRYDFIRKHPEFQNVHILGLPMLPEALSLNTISNVRSCDSSLPVKCALQGERINDILLATTYVSPSQIGIDPQLLSYNLDIFKATCNGNVRITRL